MSAIFKKLESMDRRYYYWAIFIILAVPYIKPLGLPITIKESTRSLYEGISKLGPDDIVMINYQMSVGTWPECLDGLVAELKVLTRNHVKLVFTSVAVDCELTWNKINELVPALREEYVYGEDVVFLGFFTGGEPTVRLMAEDMWKVFSTDHFGKPVEDLPLMKRARKATDFACVLTTGEFEVPWINQWWVPYKVPVACMGIAMKGSALQPYYASRDIFGLAVGVRGGAELEKLVGEPGGATTRMDAISLSHLTVVLLIVLANLGFAYTKFKGEK